MRPIPTTFTQVTETLAAESLGPVGKGAVALLQEKGYSVELGLTTAFAVEAHVIAHQASIQEYCPKDATERFKDIEVTKQWLSQGRIIFLLCKQDEAGDERLAGYAWAGPKKCQEVPDGLTTFGLRISETDQGLGLAAPYTRAMLDAATRLFACTHLWLESWGSNGGAIHTYEKLGFTKVSEKPDKRTRPNGELVDDVRLYMFLTSALR